MRLAFQPITAPTGQPDVLHRVRAAFVLKNTSLEDHCRRRGLDSSWVRRALTGQRKGPAARKLRREVCDAAGVEE